MTRDIALHRLRPLEPVLRARGISALFLFGSTARDEADERSDLDLLFDYDASSRFSLFTQASLIEELSEAVGVRVDLVAMDGLRAPFRDRVMKETVRVF